MGKWEKNNLFWEISRGGTGTKQSGTGTISVLSTGTSTGVRPEKFQFLEKWQNRNFDYKVVNFGLKKSVIYSLDLR